MNPDTPLLRCQGLRKRFAAIQALDGVDLEVARGQVVALLGENGAGKSTLVKILSGVHHPDEGQLWFDGEPYQPGDPSAAMQRGIGMVHQETNLLPALSIMENIALGRLPTTRRGTIDYRRLETEARTQLDRVGLGELDPGTPVRKLSVAAKQKVEIAKALSLDARLLVLDEPTAALAQEDADLLFGLIDELRADGVGFIYISHRLYEIPRIADAIVVLRDGAQVASWGSGTVPTEEIIQAMVGREVDEQFPDPPDTVAEPLLEVRSLHRAGAFSDVSFTLHRGEILGIAGLVGAGRTELARAIFGADPIDGGQLVLDGRALRVRSPAAAAAAGIVMIPEDRKEQGLALEQPVMDNATYPMLDRLGPIVRPSVLRQLTEQLAARVELKGSPTQPAGTLSGGNQQKVVIAKWLPRDPEVVIFDEPTRGVDVGAKQAIYRLITELAEQGRGVIVISSELPEVLGLAHRVLVLSRGKLTGDLPRDRATESAVMTHAVEG
jgi:ribose transport system ATP-binding protein